MELKLKELEFNDAFELASIFKNLKLTLSQDDVKKLEESKIKAGIQLIFNLLGDLKESKQEINTFLGHLFGITGEEFGKLKMKDLAKCFKQINEFKQSEDFKDFMDAVGQLIL
jgi:hypothetical protein